MAFAAARMILKDKRRKTSKEDFTPRNRSKVILFYLLTIHISFCSHAFIVVVNKMHTPIHEFR